LWRDEGALHTYINLRLATPERLAKIRKISCADLATDLLEEYAKYNV